MFSVNVATGAMTLLANVESTIDFGMSYDAVVDRFWVVDTGGRLFQYDPNNEFARTFVAQLPGRYTCVATVPLE